MERVILHSDINSCYASIECRERPELRERPMVVGGDEEARHGIVLAKNELAKGLGICTAETLWEARRKCPELVVVPPDFDLYRRVTDGIRRIYLEYTELCEPFGLDECWLDVSRLAGNAREGEKLAQEIRRRVKREYGVTVSVGVSFNKIFAKLGSDMKKPDAVTAIPRERFRELLWPLPVGELLYVGAATGKKLARYGIRTIGEVAKADTMLLARLLGKAGPALQQNARGLDSAPVAKYGESGPPKSVGNSMTTPRDVENEEEAKLAFLALAENVARRLREQGMRGSVVSVTLRDNTLKVIDRQRRLDTPTNLSGELAEAALALLQENYRWQRPLRSLGLSVSALSEEGEGSQTSLFVEEQHRERMEKLEATVDTLRKRYGKGCVKRGVFLGLGEMGEDHGNPWKGKI